MMKTLRFTYIFERKGMVAYVSSIIQSADEFMAGGSKIQMGISTAR